MPFGAAKFEETEAFLLSKRVSVGAKRERRVRMTQLIRDPAREIRGVGDEAAGSLDTPHVQGCKMGL